MFQGCKLTPSVDSGTLNLYNSVNFQIQVGNEFTRGVSGGERKRTNVGMELIIKPTFLFVDEPTTGLDASTAQSVMSTMKQ